MKNTNRRKKFKLKNATIGLPGALTHVLDGQELPMSNLNIPNDLKNVLEDLKANQKRPKPIMIKERKTCVFLKFSSFVSSVSLSGEVLTKKKIITDEVLVVEDVMEVSMVEVAAAPAGLIYRRHILCSTIELI